MFNAIEKRSVNYSFMCVGSGGGFVWGLISDNGFDSMLFQTIIVGHR